MRELARTKPAADDSRSAAEALGKAAMERIEKVGTTSDRSRTLDLRFNEPASFQDVARRPMDYASYESLYKRSDPTRTPVAGRVNVNPNSSRDLLAHELGHHVTSNTDKGRMVEKLRSNPKLATALSAGVFGLPFLQSSLQEGDDDAASGIAIAALASSPTLINEALATKNGLAIMEDAGMKATMGQRGRLAGAFLSYAAVPVISGLAGNTLGNYVDDYTAVYDLGASQQTPGTI